MSSSPVPGQICSLFQARLLELSGLDGPGVLPPPLARRLRIHAAECASCRRELEAYRRTIGLVRAFGRRGRVE